MSMLNRIFKSKQVKDEVKDKVKEQIDSLSGLDEAQLVEIALSSSDAKVQQEAVSRLTFGQALLGLAEEDHSARLVQMACRHIGAQLEAAPALIDTLLNESRASSQLMDLIAWSPLAIAKVVDGLSDESTLREFALQGKTSRLRQQAAEKLTGREHLEAVLKVAREKDRSVFKIVKSKLSKFKAADLELAQQQATAETLCADLEKLAKRNVDENYKRRQREIESEWAEQSQEGKMASEARFQAALSASNEKLERILAEEMAEQALAGEMESATQGLLEATADLCRVAGEVYEIAVMDAEQVSAIDISLHELDSMVKMILTRNFPLDTELAAYTESAGLVKQLWQDIQEGGSLPGLIGHLEKLRKNEADSDNDKKRIQEGESTKQKLHSILRYKSVFSNNGLEDKVPAVVSTGFAEIEAWDGARLGEIENRKRQLKKINDLIRKGSWALDSGHVRQARGIFKELEERQKKYVDLPQKELAKLEEFSEAMAKLGDWHEFAVLPKKQLLVEKMEELVGSSMHPKDLAERIKSMQADWKLLCKGGENQDKELWERMRLAADKAYEPCQQYFDEVAEGREQNLAKRKELIEQMNHYYTAYSWDNAVWKDVEKTLRVAREAWQSYWPVPGRETKTSQAAFDSVMENIYGKLKEASQAMYEAKSRLVEQAETMSKQEDVATAVNTAKLLQTQWKALGPSVAAGRKEEQKLWEAFRAYCDEIFQKRELEYSELNNQRKQELEKAKTILEQLDSILLKTGQEFTEERKRVKPLKEEFSVLGELPKNAQQKVREQFTQKLKMIEDKGVQERKFRLTKSWEVLFEIADDIRAVEEAVLNNLDTSVPLATVNENLEAIENWPAGGQAIIEKRLRETQGLTAECVSQSEKSLRLLCIRAEISKGLGSPEEDAALRMEYQVQLLEKGFGQKNQMADNDESLALEWVAVPGVEKSVYSELFVRFSRCRQQSK